MFPRAIVPGWRSATAGGTVVANFAGERCSHHLLPLRLLFFAQDRDDFILEPRIGFFRPFAKTRSVTPIAGLFEQSANALLLLLAQPERLGHITIRHRP